MFAVSVFIVFLPCLLLLLPLLFGFSIDSQPLIFIVISCIATHNSILNDHKTEKDRQRARDRDMCAPYCLLNEYYTQLVSIHIPTHYMNFYSLMDFSFFFHLSLSLFPICNLFLFFISVRMVVWQRYGFLFTHMQLAMVMLLLLFLLHAAKGNWRSLFLML